MARIVTLLVGLLVAPVLPVGTAWAAEYRCDLTNKYHCSQKQGCRSIPPKTWAQIDTDKRTYSRCNRLGCDLYDADFNTSGAFVTIEVNGRGLMAKMQLDGSSFVEVATLATDVYTSFGSCRPRGQ